MPKQIRIRGVRRKQIDEEKLALALLLLAKILHDESDDNSSFLEAAESYLDGETPPQEAA